MIQTNNTHEVLFLKELNEQTSTCIIQWLWHIETHGERYMNKRTSGLAAPSFIEINRVETPNYWVCLKPIGFMSRFSLEKVEENWLLHVFLRKFEKSTMEMALVFFWKLFSHSFWSFWFIICKNKLDVLKFMKRSFYFRIISFFVYSIKSHSKILR